MSTTLTARATSAPSARATTFSPRGVRAFGYAVLAAIAYVPLLATAPGRVVADTKSYLYLDPGRLLDRAPSMWDPNIGLGTVTHQNIGYVFPMGPYYWAMHFFGVPAWVSQRLWLGSILFFAAVGVLYLLRTLHVHGPGVVVAALVFMLSPYLLDFAARLSVILLPWAGLPWMLALVVRALRDSGWKYPAVFAIVVQVIGSVNATALVFAGIVPVMWVLYAWLVTREVDWRRTAATVAKIVLLTVLASLWWIVGLAVQSGYGLDILKFTETMATVSHSSLPSEVLRGLGYWFFYGGDKISAWIVPSVRYTQEAWLMTASFALPLLAFVAAAIVRWRHRAFFVLVAFVGVVAAVGAYPYGDPSLLGRFFKSFAASSSFGLAMRSTARAIPLLALVVAVLIGLGVNALAAAWSARGARVASFALAALVIVLAAVNLPSLWTGDLLGDNLTRDENIPAYWTDAIAHVNAGPHDTRVLEIPGADFASYRWGNTVDPITPGLTDRPYVARELVPWGSAATADLLNALDRRMQEGVLDPAAIAPIARLMDVGDVLYRADLQTDRFDLVRSVPLWQLLTQPRPNGLGAPATYGDRLAPPLHYSQIDEAALAQAPGASDPPPVSVFPVRGTAPIVHTSSASNPLIVAGDGEGLVDLAGLGALDGAGVVLYSGSYAADPSALRQQIAQPGSVLVVTDSNRKRGRRWGAIGSVEGATERVNQTALTKDEGDNRLDVFPGATSDAETVVQSPGAAVSATRYGNVITYWPEMRGERAFDGDVATAWEVGDHASVIGEKIRVDLDHPITTDHVNLVQPLVGPRARFITKATLTFDGEHSVDVDLHDASRTPDGETITFPQQTFRRFEITVDDTNVGDTFDYPTSNNVGFAEIRLRDRAVGAKDVRANEIVRMPTDLVDAAGALAGTRPLVFEMSRSRTIVIPPRYSQDEVALVRQLRVPNARAFSVAGTLRLATAAPDDVLDAALGIPGADAGGITVRASQHLPGDVRARGSAAFDGDTATAWSTAFGNPEGQWLDVETAAPVGFDHLDLAVVADGRHSVPTQLRIDAGGESRTVDLPAIADASTQNATVPVSVAFEPLRASDVRVTVTKIRPVSTIEYHENQPIVMPVALAEVGIPGVHRAPVPAQLPSACRRDLLSVDGVPLPIRITGSSEAAQRGEPVDFVACDGALNVSAGDHVVRSAEGTTTAIDVDGLVLGSDAAGAPLALGPGGSFSRATAPTGDAAAVSQPRVRVLDDGRTTKRLRVDGARPGEPFWLVLGESNSTGWHASVAGDDLGRPALVDGYANGWQVLPTASTFTIDLEWTPQRSVWVALAISAATFVVCLAIALWPRRRRERLAGTPSREHEERALAVDASVDGTVVLANPLVADAADPPVTMRVAIGTAVAAGIVGAVVARWWVGLIVAACVFAVALRPRMRALLTLGGPVFLALTAAYVIVQQARHHYPYGYFWVEHFGRVTELAWLAVLFLAADAFLELVRRRRPERA